MLTVVGLTKRFGARTIIEKLSFRILPGSRVTVFAPSGSGKTTLIQILSGLEHEFDGTVTLHAQRLATIFQEPRLFPYLTVRENICLPLKIQRLTLTAELRAEYVRWLEVCGLTAYEQHYPYQLSGGMKQKVSIIRSFLPRPDFVMLDEPFTSIDIASKYHLIRHLLDHSPATTILFVTHNLDEIPLLTDTLLLFSAPVLGNFTTYHNLTPARLSTIIAEFIQTAPQAALAQAE